MKRILLVVLLIVCCAGSVLGRRVYELVWSSPVNYVKAYEYQDGVHKGDKLPTKMSGEAPYYWSEKTLLDTQLEQRQKEESGLVDVVTGVLKWDTIGGFLYREATRPDFKYNPVESFDASQYMGKDEDMLKEYSVDAVVKMKFASSYEEFQYIQDQYKEEELYIRALHVQGWSGLAVATLVDPNTYLAVFLIATIAGPFGGRRFRDLKKVTDQGHAMVQRNLGGMYSKGQGVPQDYTKAVKWARKAADQGDDKAQVNLGLMYSKGQGVPQNYAKALTCYTKAAEQGNAGAQSDLARMYVSGGGIPQNYKEAFRWYAKAAEQGHASAQYSLGTMYNEGWGVPTNSVKAYTWFSLSFAQGHEPAKKELSICAKQMTAEQIAEAQAIAAELWNTIKK